jgi:hypothetical protein
VLPPVADPSFADPSLFVEVPESPQPTATSASVAAHAIHMRGANKSEASFRVFMNVLQKSSNRNQPPD